MLRVVRNVPGEMVAVSPVHPSEIPTMVVGVEDRHKPHILLQSTRQDDRNRNHYLTRDEAMKLVVALTEALRETS